MPKRNPQNVSQAPAVTDGETYDFEFHREPGHLIRRLHQIATALFLEKTRSLEVTPVQYAALNAIGRHPNYEQRDIARLIAIDRTTINIVTSKLHQRGWVMRAREGRVVNLTLTDEGAAMLAELDRLTSGHGDDLLNPLSTADRLVFTALLERLVQDNNGLSRVPMRARAR